MNPLPPGDRAIAIAYSLIIPIGWIQFSICWKVRAAKCLKINNKETKCW